MTFEELKDLMLFHRIVRWNDNTIELDNGVSISIVETKYDCCARAEGTFTNVVLDAAITDISPIQRKAWQYNDTYGCCARVAIMHNQNLICSAYADADADNGGYCYSIASFVVSLPDEFKTREVEFVTSDDNSDDNEVVYDDYCHFIEEDDGNWFKNFFSKWYK